MLLNSLYYAPAEQVLSLKSQVPSPFSIANLAMCGIPRFANFAISNISQIQPLPLGMTFGKAQSAKLVGLVK